MKKTKAIKENNVISEASKGLDASTRQLLESSKDVIASILGGDEGRNLVEQTIREEIRSLLTEDEDDDKDFDVDEVEDTETDDVAPEGEEENQDAVEPESGEEVDEPAEDNIDEPAGDDSVETPEVPEADAEGEDIDVDVDDDEDEWGAFDDLKVDDDTYDFSNADFDQFKKVFKLMNDDDTVQVGRNDDGSIHIADKETGAEYVIMDGDGKAEQNVDAPDLDGVEEGCEQPIKEYDSHVGYTDNYQKKDVMTNDGNEEPANSKSTRSWDKGVPTGTQKPWAGKGDTQPFDNKVNEGCEEEGCEDEDVVEEAPARTSTKLSHRVKSATNGDSQEGRPHRSPNSVNGVLTKEQTQKILSRAKKIQEENAQLKVLLGKFKTALNEHMVTNYNLGKVVKLVMECSTTYDEKKELIERFSKEAKTRKAADQLYEAYKSRFSKAGAPAAKRLDESMTVNGEENMAEKTVYRNPEIDSILSLMKKLG